MLIIWSDSESRVKKKVQACHGLLFFEGDMWISAVNETLLLKYRTLLDWSLNPCKAVLMLGTFMVFIFYSESDY